jgi:hypothetical protein
LGFRSPCQSLPQLFGSHFAGVSAWRDPHAKAGDPCALRILFGTLDARFIALDASTGKLCSAFGADGSIDLSVEASTTPEWRGGYQVTSAPAIAKDLFIVGSSIADNWKVDVGRGIVRAFDARTGKLRWTWDPIPWANSTTPRTGAGNAWSTLSVDAEHDLVLFPLVAPARTTSAAFVSATQMGKLRRRSSRFHWPIRLGISSRSSRPMGLRRRFAAHAFHLERRHARRGHQHQNGPRLRSESFDRCSASSC